MRKAAADEERQWIMDPRLDESPLMARRISDHTAVNEVAVPGLASLSAGSQSPMGRARRSHHGAGDLPADPNFATPEDVLHMEKQYLLACERGDMGSVRHFVALADQNKQFNLSCVDPLGRTALLIAIENENIEMIEILLDADVETGDAILYAINEENVEAVEIILNHLEKLDKFNAENQGVEITEHSAFTPDVTPIILAAHRDNYEIIKLLLDRGASIPHPHDVRCSCKDCIRANSDDSLRLSRSRINAYRALASPSLVCLSARDPLLYAFELSWELRRLSYIENEFKREYVELSQTCQRFTVDMLDQVRGSKELEIILNHDTSDRWTSARERAPGERMQLSRLKLAIQFRQKKFVAHPNCQQLLASIWYEGLPGFRRRNFVFKILLILAVAAAFPLLSFSYLIAPKSGFSKFIRKPFIKFLCHVASYCFFLFLLILASQRINYDEIFWGSAVPADGSGNGSGERGLQAMATDYDRKERRGPPPTPVEVAIALYVVGLIWVEVKQLWDMGLHDYCYNMWNILDFITNALYLCTAALRIIAYLQVETELADPQRHHIARSLPRRKWHAWDPTLISELIFATANIFSQLKLVHMFTVNPHLGPLQISLGRMVIDIMKFLVLYGLVLFAFACGLNQLFWYYATMRAQECDAYQREQVTAYADSCDERYAAFKSLFHTLETLFWAIFGLVDLDRFSLKEHHSITEWAGKTMFGTYGIISIIVLLNMLIAMMSNSYQYIWNQADVEWKFARSKLWIAYFEDGATLPPPFNIVPSPKSFYYMLKHLCEKFCKCSRRIQHTKQRSIRLQKILKAVSQKEANYQFVMRNLIKRYIAHEQRQKQQSEGVSEDDVNEIKQDISSFRFELLAILRNAGYNTGHADVSQRTSARSKKRSAQAERRLMKGFQLNIEPIPEGFLPKPAAPAAAAPSPRRTLLPTALSPTKVASLPAIASTFSRLKKFSKRVNWKDDDKRPRPSLAKSASVEMDRVPLPPTSSPSASADNLALSPVSPNTQLPPVAARAFELAQPGVWRSMDERSLDSSTEWHFQLGDSADAVHITLEPNSEDTML